jgi:hypothetical protein
MNLNKKLFPYPILTNSSQSKGYKKQYFIVNFLTKIEKNEFVIFDLNYRIDNKKITQLITEKKANIYCLIECSETLFRKKYNILMPITELRVNLDHLKGTVNISYFIVSNDLIGEKNIDGLDEDYKDVVISFNNYEIIGFDSGIVLNIDVEEEIDNKNNSFIVITKNEDIKDNSIAIETQNKRIVISVSEDVFDKYNSISKVKSLENVFFSTLALHGMYHLFSATLKSDDYSFDMLEEDLPWFTNIKKTYKQKYSEDITANYFKENTFELCQKILGHPIGKAVNEVYNILNKKEEIESD